MKKSNTVIYTHKFKTTPLLLVSMLASAAVFANDTEVSTLDLGAYMTANAQVVNIEKRTVKNEVITAIKYKDALTGEIKGFELGGDNQLRTTHQKTVSTVVADSLQKLLNQEQPKNTDGFLSWLQGLFQPQLIPQEKLYKVVVGFKTLHIPYTGKPIQGSATIKNGETVVLRVNGENIINIKEAINPDSIARRASLESVVQKMDDYFAQEQVNTQWQQQQNTQRRQQHLHKTATQLLTQYHWLAQPNLVTDVRFKTGLYEAFATKNVISISKKAPSLTEQLQKNYGSATLWLTKTQINALATQTDVISTIEPYAEAKPTVASAMLNSGINPHALNFSGNSNNRRGRGIGIFVSEGADCPNNNYTNNYTRLSGSRAVHSELVVGIARAVAPESYIYCDSDSGNTKLPTQSEIMGTGGNPRIQVVNASFAYTASTCGSIYTAYDAIWDDFVYNHNIATFIASGNNDSCPADDNVTSPGKALNAVTVGNHTDWNTIHSKSNHINSEISNEKPELTAPGTNITVGNIIDKHGTSLSSAHAAAFAADLLSAYPWMRDKPYYLKAIMLAGATKHTGTAATSGVGGIDFHRTANNSMNTRWIGNNASFDYFDQHDGKPNNGFIDYTAHLKPSYGKVRVAIAWLNRGSYIQANKRIGMDIDLIVRDPSGKYVTGSVSGSNPYEVVEFTPTKIGDYIFQIKRYGNYDTASDFKLGLSINWQ